ncbi:MAG: hypothetical protein H7Z75_18580, partial [Ferruginibacter sp.]|nr:hypothetical protein [Cytophagales bacterium]
MATPAPFLGPAVGATTGVSSFFTRLPRVGRGWAVAVVVSGLLATSTQAQPQLVKDIRPGYFGSFPFDASPQYLTNVGSVSYFEANDGIHGRELWKSDGTPAGTVLVKDIHPSTSSSG